jgi:hypothetical protein
MAMKYVPFYFSYIEPLSRLSDAQRGRVVLALLHYGASGTEPDDLDTEERLTFDFLRLTFDLRAASYETAVERKRENGKKGGAPKGNRNACRGEKFSTVETVEKQPKDKGERRKDKGERIKDKGEAIAAVAAIENSRPPPPERDVENFFTENGFGPASYAPQALQAYREKGCPDDLLLRCMQEALDSGNPRWNYTKAILDRCLREEIGTAAAFDESRKHGGGRGGGMNIRVDRETPSGNDFLATATDRPRRLKRKD